VFQHEVRKEKEMRLYEIARIPAGDFGDEETLRAPKNPVEKKPLPGGSGFTYAIDRPTPESIEIMIFDGDTLAAEMDLGYTQDELKTWQVDSVVTAPTYRGRGLGKALYGIALSVLKLTLEAGQTQTKHGQAMWLMLNSIPGVEVMGYDMAPTKQYSARPGDKIVSKDNNYTRYTFPVKPGVKSMRSGRKGTGIYSSAATSMIAKWTGNN
jgi:GNAT superfamily N-acetyltransferase